jgi:hypothetical protein
VKSAVVYHMHYNLPRGKAGIADEARFEGNVAGDLGVTGGIGPCFPFGLETGPFFYDELERRERVVRGHGIAWVGTREYQIASAKYM